LSRESRDVPDGHTDMTKPMVTFDNFAKAPEKCLLTILYIFFFSLFIINDNTNLTSLVPI